MRLSGKIFLFSTLIVTGSATVACKPKSGASIKAIHLADKSISLLSGRLYAPQGSGVAYENSIRMMMLPIGCPPNQIRNLEEMVQRNVESLRHIGPRIVGADGQPIRGAESCAIFTSFAVHPWAYGTLFDRPARTKGDFIKQQWVWLAMRGRTTSNGSGFAAGFDRWMNEGGIFANMPQPLVDRKIEHWDRLYNPCQRTDAAKVFGIDKREFFSCVNGDYEPKSDKLGSLLVNMLNESGQDLVMRIRANEFHMYDTTGLEQAIVIQNPQSAVAKAQSGTGKTGKSASLGLVSKTAKWGYRARSAGGSAYQSRTPLFYAGYSKYGNTTRPAPVLQNQQPYYSRYRNQTTSFNNPASAQYRPSGDRTFSFPDNPNTLYVSSDVTRDYRGSNYGEGSGYTTERRVNSTTGEVEFVDRFANGRSIFWQQDAFGGWTRTGVGSPATSWTAGPSVGRNADGTLIADVTNQMRRQYGQSDAYSPRDTVSTAVVSPDGTVQIVDQRYNSSGQLIPGSSRRFQPNGDGSMTQLLPPQPVAAAYGNQSTQSDGGWLFDALQRGDVTQQEAENISDNRGVGPSTSNSMPVSFPEVDYAVTTYTDNSNVGSTESPESFIPAASASYTVPSGGNSVSSPEDFVPSDE
ncbi:MAG: hypothetical protein EBU49_05285 [Proteobacteria bacterium]|nr:hypothetical protein [Pseudomonadota bacterium]